MTGYRMSLDPQTHQKSRFGHTVMVDAEYPGAFAPVWLW